MAANPLFDMIDSLSNSYIDVWEDVCNIESPTTFKKGVDEVGKYFVRLAEEKGWKCEVFPQEIAGDVVCITMNPEVDAPPVVISGHTDTVHPVGLFGNPPVRKDDENIYGPGVTDCKGGVVAGALAMDALSHCGFTSRPVMLLLQSDEEMSSAPSKLSTINQICEKAKEAVAFLNCEPYREGKLVVLRKGILRMRFNVRGRAGHSSLCYNGASAIAEATHKIIELEKLKDPDGLTCNCGMISGGTAQNTVPEECSFTADIRFLTNEQCDLAREITKNVAESSTIPGCSCTLEELSFRPAMVHSQKNMDLLAKINEIFVENGIPAVEGIRANGGSDAAYATQYGIPCIDSIGTAGANIHSVRECGKLSSLAESAKRIAAIAYHI